MNVEECDYHINIISPMLVRVVFLFPTSARTDALHSIKAERECGASDITVCAMHLDFFAVSLK
jgi:hypothetical protein